MEWHFSHPIWFCSPIPGFSVPFVPVSKVPELLRPITAHAIHCMIYTKSKRPSHSCEVGILQLALEQRSVHYVRVSSVSQYQKLAISIVLILKCFKKWASRSGVEINLIPCFDANQLNSWLIDLFSFGALLFQYRPRGILWKYWALSIRPKIPRFPVRNCMER